jgi:hypothetical protein
LTLSSVASAGHVEAVQVGQHHVQHDEVGTVALDGLESLQPPVAVATSNPGQAQAGRQQLQDVGLVLDDKEPGLGLGIAHARHSDRSSLAAAGRFLGACWERG